MLTLNETILTVGMVGSAAWATFTGDTFLPALGGALFATYLRHEMREEGLDFYDYVISGVMSYFIGIIAGPWVASQLPHGDGVVGVGTLMAAFTGVLIFTKLYDYVKATNIFSKHKDE